MSEDPSAKPSMSFIEMTKMVNDAECVWAMVNYEDGTFFAVVKDAARAKWIGDDLGYNMSGESFATPEDALADAIKKWLITP